MTEIRDTIITRFSLSEDATDEQILETLRKRLKKYHPDMASGEEIAKCYSQVFDETKKLYDEFREQLKLEKTTDIVSLSGQDDRNPLY